MNAREKVMADAIEEAEARDAEVTAGYQRPSPPASPAQVYSVRIPVDQIEMLRRLASAKGERPSSLMRQWVLERLQEEASGCTVRVSVQRRARSDIPQLQRLRAWRLAA